MLQSFQNFFDNKSDNNAFTFGFVEGMKNPQRLSPDMASVSDEWKADIIISFSYYVSGFYASKAVLILAILFCARYGIPYII